MGNSGIVPRRTRPLRLGMGDAIASGGRYETAPTAPPRRPPRSVDPCSCRTTPPVRRDRPDDRLADLRTHPRRSEGVPMSRPPRHRCGAGHTRTRDGLSAQSPSRPHPAAARSSGVARPRIRSAIQPGAISAPPPGGTMSAPRSGVAKRSPRPSRGEHPGDSGTFACEPDSPGSARRRRSRPDPASPVAARRFE